MKAIFFEEHGGPEVLKYADLPDPSAGEGQALIRVSAVALNHLDIWVRKGWKGLRLNMPHIGGSDIAGEVIEVHGSKSIQAGARVVVNPGVVTGEDEWTRRGEESLSPSYRIIGEQLAGGLAEYVSVPVRNLFRIPDGVSFEQAAAAPLVATTCWRMLFRRANLKPFHTVLVVGSGGGVNSLSIQLAASIGARVFCLAGGTVKAKKAKTLGAEIVIDYQKSPDWHLKVLQETQGRGVDIVIDNVGRATVEQSMKCCRRGGVIVSVGNTSGFHVEYDNRLLFSKQLSLIGSTMGSRQDFVEALEFLWRRGIHPVIDSVRPLSEGLTAIRRLEEGEHFGKIILSPK